MELKVDVKGDEEGAYKQNIMNYITKKLIKKNSKMLSASSKKWKENTTKTLRQ